MDFDKIYEYAGKEFLENEYKEFECKPKWSFVNEEYYINKSFDLGLKVNLSKFAKCFESLKI